MRSKIIGIVHHLLLVVRLFAQNQIGNNPKQDDQLAKPPAIKDWYGISLASIIDGVAFVLIVRHLSWF